MGFESALWEATRPAFRVRYIHDPGGQLHIPLYASYGVATGPTARAKLARIVRGAPEVVVKVTGRQRGGSHVKAHLDYIGRKGDVEIETRDGEILTSKDDIAERAAEWSDTLEWRSRPTVSSVSLIFSMPKGTDPDKVLGAVRALAHAELSDNHDYVLALHTDTPRPHVHLTVQAEGLNRTRFNPRPVQLNRFRERFARELRARGVAAEATPRRARGRGIAGSSMALVKIRARLRTEGSRQITDSDRRTNEQAIAVARGAAGIHRSRHRALAGNTVGLHSSCRCAGLHRGDGRPGACERCARVPRQASGHECYARSLCGALCADSRDEAKWPGPASAGASAA